MAPSSKSERAGPGAKRGTAGAAGGSSAGQGSRGRREHIVRQLERVRISGQLSPRLFRKLPPRACISLKSIVDEEFLCAGHIFLGFSKCGRFVLSYTSSSGDDEFSFYIYHLYWWEFRLHGKLRLVRQVRLFQDEQIYSDLYLTVCEWPSDSSKLIVFGFNTRSAHGLLVNMMMMSDENHRDIYVSAVAVPPPRRCPSCRRAANGEAAQCLRHGFMLHTKFQVVYPFPTFQPAFQLKQDGVVLLNTSYSLVACAVSVHSAGDSSTRQILYNRRTSSPPSSSHSSSSSHRGGCSSAHPEEPCPPPAPQPPPSPGRPPGPSPAVAKAKEFVADIFRRAKEATGGTPAEEEEEEEEEEEGGGGGPAAAPQPRCPPVPPPSPRGDRSPPTAGSPPGEPGYVNYTKLRYVLPPGTPAEPQDGPPPEPEDDKISLPFVVTDLRGRSLWPLREHVVAQGQFLAVEQLTLDFEYVINEVIRHDAAWAPQFCSFSDYDVVILEVCPDTNQVLINIGLLLLAFPAPDEEEGLLRPRPHHTSLKVAWDLSSGAFSTVGVGALSEVRGQTSGSVWSSYRKGCVDTVMRCIVPESSGRFVNRMTNEALHKGCSLKVLADAERFTWIVL